MTLKSDAKFEEKLTVGSKNDMRNLVNFDTSSGKSENGGSVGVAADRRMGISACRRTQIS